MGFTVTVDHGRRRVEAKAVGPITLGDIRSHLEEERGKGGLPYKELIDARGATPEFSASDVRALVGIFRKLAEGSFLGRTAILSDSAVGYGMLRMIEMLVGDVALDRPFRNQDEAEEWLEEGD
jgi:hypothetical protein